MVAGKDSDLAVKVKTRGGDLEPSVSLMAVVMVEAVAVEAAAMAVAAAAAMVVAAAAMALVHVGVLWVLLEAQPGVVEQAKPIQLLKPPKPLQLLPLQTTGATSNSRAQQFRTEAPTTVVNRSNHHRNSPNNRHRHNRRRHNRTGTRDTNNRCNPGSSSHNRHNHKVGELLSSQEDKPTRLLFLKYHSTDHHHQG